MMHLFDENFWLAISFCIFIYLIYRPIKKTILATLDAKITVIKTEILEAEKLKTETTALYQQITEQINQLPNLQAQMLAEGRKNIDHICTTKNKEMMLFLERKKTEAISQIEALKLAALKEIQAEFSDKVIDLAAKHFESNLI